MLNWLDWTIVCAPILLAVGGVWLSIRPVSKKYHLVLGIGLIALGIAVAAASLIQIRHTRVSDLRTALQTKEDKEQMQATIDGLKGQITKLSETSIPKLLGDVEGLKPPKRPLPDLSLRFVYSTEVSIEVVNAIHAGVADRPKYGAQLLDLDNLPADALRIPAQMGDYIRPGEFWGPNQFMGLDAVKSVVKAGDRIFGSVQVSCPACVKTRGYWLFIKAGQGGWYAEQQQPRAIASLAAATAIAQNFDAYVDVLAPKSKRVSIK